MGKKLGQHFLHSPAVLERIMAAAALEPGEPVLEPGPGRGVLTERLLAAGVRVTAVELDRELCAALRERWGADASFRLIEQDVLAADLSPAALFGQERAYAIVSNLPYQISTPFLFRAIAHRNACSRMLLMVQKEVAERLVALPVQGKVYGSLSVAAHYAFHMQRLFTVPPGAFRPPPKVHSAVVAFQPRAPHLPRDAEARFFEHVKMLFTTRRKRMLAPLLRRYPALDQSRLAAIEGLVGDLRAEALDPETHLQVFRLLDGRAGEKP